MTRRFLIFLAVAAASPAGAQSAGASGSAPSASPDSSRTRLHLDAFIDGYYAYDFGKPAGHDRPFLTQAARANEFNVNLAHLAASLDRPNLRARLALQAGTSVQANYAAEPTTGNLSGPTLARHLQEATIGVRAASSLWIDAGIYLSYLGWEGWQSAGNPVYTRSFVSEFSPYYLSGVRATAALTNRFTVQVHLMNGWQNIAENNDAKAVGLRADFVVSDHLTLVYGNFLGNERPAGTPAAPRFFQQLMAKGDRGRFSWQGQFDYGREGRAGTTSRWYGWAAIGRWALDSANAVGLRAERYHDPDQAIVATGGTAGFAAWGASAGWDRTLAPGLLWRTEYRWISAEAPLFSRQGRPGRSKTNQSVVTSLAVTF